MREVHFYRTKSGDCPVEEFLDALTGKQAQKVWVLRLVEQLDPVPAQYLKKLVDTDGLWEVRAQHGGDTFRLLGFFDGASVPGCERLRQEVGEDATARNRRRGSAPTGLPEQEKRR